MLPIPSTAILLLQRVSGKQDSKHRQAVFNAYVAKILLLALEMATTSFMHHVHFHVKVLPIYGVLAGRVEVDLFGDKWLPYDAVLKLLGVLRVHSALELACPVKLTLDTQKGVPLL